MGRGKKEKQRQKKPHLSIVLLTGLYCIVHWPRVLLALKSDMVKGHGHDADSSPVCVCVCVSMCV